MPISRDPRMDRRRRILLDGGDDDGGQSVHSKSSRRRAAEPEESSPRRSAGYSQEVRRACGQRLVQLIPVRKRSYLAAILVSLLVPGLLLTAHYMIYVSGSLPWYGHPLAVAWDASHPSSIASWFSSHLWLLCLAATVLTFQLRRHKLDDYDGEYRLWFWLVVTCLVASIDATTHLADLFGLALDRWSQINLGWSGPAVVEATLAVLIGMLGLRLCSELKSVPTSLAFWLIGLVAWAGSAALAQEELKVELSLQFRIWLKAALWLGGLTAVWLAALSYLRSVYLEAQRRFLLRGRLATAQGAPLAQRLKEAWPPMPQFRRRETATKDDGDEGEQRRWAFKMPTMWNRNSSSDDGHASAPEETDRQRRRRERREAAEAPSKAAEGGTRPEIQAKRAAVSDQGADADESPGRRGLGSFWRKTRHVEESPQAESASQRPSGDETPEKTSRWNQWLRKPKDSDEPEEYRKVKAKPRPNKESSDAESSSEKVSWRSRLPKISRPKMPSIPKPNIGGMLSKIKLPSLRLPPPDESNGEDEADSTMRSVQSDRPLPGTNPDAIDASQGQPSERPLSKAERKRLRRMRQQNRAA